MHLANLLLLGSALAATVKSPSTSFYLYNNNEIELVGPYPEDKFLPLFKKYGEVHVEKNTIHLNANRPNQQAAVWSKRPMIEKHWQVVTAFRIKGNVLGGNGLGFWYVRDGHRTGAVYGGPDKFEGLGLFFDTFDEETKSETVPMVVGMMGDGMTSFRQAANTTSTENKVVGSCFKSVRNTDAPVYVRVTYFNRHLKVEIDNQSEGRAYNTCFDAFDLELPIGYHFGVSAATNMYPDKYELYALRSAVFSTVSRHADQIAVDKMTENEIFKDQSTVVRLIENVKLMADKQNDLLTDFRMVLGRPAVDQLPLNNRMEALERDIRHLDNHLDRTEETLHALMILMKKSVKESSGQASNNDSETWWLANLRTNYMGYLIMLGVQGIFTCVLLMLIKRPKGPQRKAL